MKCQTALFALTTSKRMEDSCCVREPHFTIYMEIMQRDIPTRRDRFIWRACINLILLRFYVTAIHLLSKQQKIAEISIKKVELFAAKTHHSTSSTYALLFERSHSFKHYLFDFLSIWFETGIIKSTINFIHLEQCSPPVCLLLLYPSSLLCT